MEDRGNLGHAALIQARNQLFGLAARDPLLAQVRPAAWMIPSSFTSTIDQEKANALGVSTADINATLSAAWGGALRQQFHRPRPGQARLYRRRRAYRMTPEIWTAGMCARSTGTMAPFSSFARADWTLGPTTLTRYNGLPAIEIQGRARRASAPAPRLPRWTSCSSNCRRGGL